MTIDTLTHIQNLQAAAIDLEDRMRKSGLYAPNNFTRDCDRVSDAVRRGMKSGFAFLVGEDGEPEVIPLGANAGSVQVTKGKAPDNWGVTYNQAGPEEARRKETSRMVVEASEAPYRQMAEGEEFAKAASRSHEPGNRTEGKFPPQVHEGKNPLGDAARQIREREAYARSRRNALSDEAKNFTRAQMDRNNRIAAQMKAASDKQWKTRSA